MRVRASQATKGKQRSGGRKLGMNTLVLQVLVCGSEVVTDQLGGRKGPEFGGLEHFQKEQDFI